MIAHGGGPRLTEAHPELDWVHVTGNAIVNVFSCVQQAVGSENDFAVVQSVRSAVRK